MRLIIFCMLLLPLTVSQANSNLPLLEEALNCRHSVFYGEVLSGNFTKSMPDRPTTEIIGEGYGAYKIKVVAHIAGKKMLSQGTVQGDYIGENNSALLRTYPAPGKQYIFILSKAGRSLKFSPYHLPRVEIINQVAIVSGGQYQPLHGVTAMIKTSDGDIKEATDINEGNFIGYQLASYIEFVSRNFRPCPNAK